MLILVLAIAPHLVTVGLKFGIVQSVSASALHVLLDRLLRTVFVNASLPILVYAPRQYVLRAIYFHISHVGVLRDANHSHAKMVILGT